ncbi:MAG: TRAP transporter small permease subunit, partial [Candidatus Binatia bacterium]
MNAIYTAYNQVLNGFKIGSGIVVFLVFLLIVIDVFVRLVGLQPSTYTSAIVEYCLLWFTMLAAPWLVRIKGHVFIDA